MEQTASLHPLAMPSPTRGHEVYVLLLSDHDSRSLPWAYSINCQYIRDGKCYVGRIGLLCCGPMVRKASKTMVPGVRAHKTLMTILLYILDFTLWPLMGICTVL